MSGRAFEDFHVGDVYKSAVGRTVSQADNTWFADLARNTNQIHFNAHYSAATEFQASARQQPLHARGRHRAAHAGDERAPVNSNLVLAYIAEHVLGLPRSY